MVWYGMYQRSPTQKPISHSLTLSVFPSPPGILPNHALVWFREQDYQLTRDRHGLEGTLSQTARGVPSIDAVVILVGGFLDTSKATGAGA